MKFTTVKSTIPDHPIGTRAIHPNVATTLIFPENFQKNKPLVVSQGLLAGVSHAMLATMGKASGPPKCRTCGKEEWRHLCGGAVDVKVAVESMGIKSKANRGSRVSPGKVMRRPAETVRSPETPVPPLVITERRHILRSDPYTTAPAGQVPCGAPTKVAEILSLAPEKPKRDRKEYQRELMRDRRAADKAGLTVAEYRAQKSKKEIGP